MNNYQSMMRGYKDTPRVGLQYCHVPTESAYGKLLADSEKEERHRLPEAFPCVTTGSLIAHPTASTIVSHVTSPSTNHQFDSNKELSRRERDRGLKGSPTLSN